jgi:hypothetical protein
MNKEYWWNDNQQGNTELLGEQHLPTPHSRHKFHTHFWDILTKVRATNWYDNRNSTFFRNFVKFCQTARRHIPYFHQLYPNKTQWNFALHFSIWYLCCGHSCVLTEIFNACANVWLCFCPLFKQWTIWGPYFSYWEDSLKTAPWAWRNM